MGRKPGEPMRQYMARLSPTMIERIEAEAEKRGESAAVMIREAIREWLDRQAEKAKNNS